jgi:hypothetical protein
MYYTCINIHFKITIHFCYRELNGWFKRKWNWRVNISTRYFGSITELNLNEPPEDGNVEIAEIGIGEIFK